MASVLKLIADGQTCNSRSMDMWNKGVLCIFSRMKRELESPRFIVLLRIELKLKL